MVVTENSVQSDWVRAEVNTAMNDLRFQGRVVPLTNGTAELSQLSHEFGQVNAVDLSSTPDPGEMLSQYFARREAELRSSK